MLASNSQTYTGQTLTTAQSLLLSIGLTSPDGNPPAAPAITLDTGAAALGIGAVGAVTAGANSTYAVNVGFFPTLAAAEVASPTGTFVSSTGNMMLTLPDGNTIDVPLTVNPPAEEQESVNSASTNAWDGTTTTVA